MKQTFAECPECGVNRLVLIPMLEGIEGQANRAMAESLVMSCRADRQWWERLKGIEV